MIKIDDLKNYLGIDYDHTMIIANLERSLKTADAFLMGAIGVDYPKDDPRAEELTLIVAGELYDNRGLMLSNGISNTVRRIVDDFSLQLRLELANANKEVVNND
jgi:hypothetical protein